MNAVEKISEARASELNETAKELATARKTGIVMDDLGEPLQVQSLVEAYYVHGQIAQLFNTIGGWKVGAPSPDATPLFAPMPLRWFNTDATLPGSTAVIEGHRYRGVEAEIAFVMGAALPPRSEKYSRDEVIAAIASCHPAIELLESAFVNPEKVSRFTTIADLQNNGGFVPGPAVTNWQQIDFTKEGVQVIVDGVVEVERVASNSAGTDLVRLVQWLANEGTVAYGGLKAGDWITTGSWTGKTLCRAGAEVEVKFSTAGSVKLKYA